MTEVRLIQIVALIVFILMVVALTALTDYLLEPRKETDPPQQHVVNWCDTHGHKYLRQDGWLLCVHCGDTIRPIDAPLDQEGPRFPSELGHQRQTGRAA